MPWRGRSSSRMISGRRRDTTYEATENLNPGKTSSVTAAPPRTCLRSQTTTFFPARARYAAWTSPLCPPPITIASYFEFILTYQLQRKLHHHRIDPSVELETHVAQHTRMLKT